MAIELTTGNAALIEETVVSLLIQPLEQESTFLSAGPRVIASNGPIRIPRLASSTGANFVAEGAQIGDADVAFDELDLLPSTMKGLKALVKMSNELIRSSTVALESVLRQRLVHDVALSLDAALWDHDGTSNTIKGILRQAGIGTGVLNLTDPDSLIDAMTNAEAEHVAPTHWVMTPESFAKLRKIKTTTGSKQYLFDPDGGIANGTARRLLGLPVIITENIPALGATPKARVGLVDFSKVVVVRDVNAEVKVLDQTWGDYDSVGIRVVSRWDVGLLHSKAVTVLTEA